MNALSNRLEVEFDDVRDKILHLEVAMKDFYNFLLTMGGLHDSIVECLTWLPGEKKIEFRFENMYRNFEGLPEYPGQQSGVITLHGVSSLLISVETDNPLRVFEFLPDKSEPDAVLLTFWPTGKIRVRFNSADYPPCRLILPEPLLSPPGAVRPARPHRP